MKADYKEGDRVEVISVPYPMNKKSIGKKGTVINNDIKAAALQLYILMDFTQSKFYFDYEHVKPIV